VFRIDGNWSASDFSHFHGKISNLYAMMLILNRMDLPGVEQVEKAYIKDSIERRFWMGGGSYIGFYDDLFDHVKSLNPLDVERIQYASPGQIALRGDGEAFSDIDRIIDTFDANHKQLRSMYNSLHGILRKERLLRARAGTRFSNPEQTEYVRLLTIELADKMKLEKRDEIFEACNRNTLVFCKVVLSIYRRVNEIYMFHEEGRVQSD
jgi:hypothetical protein